MPNATTSTLSGTYRYTIGGEVEGTPHEPGDKVPESVPDGKKREWLKAGVIEKEKAQKTSQRSKEKT